MNIETTQVTFSITKQTWDKFLELTNAQNASIHNNANRALQLYVDETLKKFPNLALQQDKG